MYEDKTQSSASRSSVREKREEDGSLIAHKLLRDTLRRPMMTMAPLFSARYDRRTFFFVAALTKYRFMLIFFACASDLMS